MGKVWVVTGASGGIGKAVSAVAAQSDARVMMVDVSAERLSEAAKELSDRHGTDRIAHRALDVTSESDMSAMVDATKEAFGRIDVLVAAAGILRPTGQPQTVQDTTFDSWRRVIDVNLTGVFLSNRAVIDAMLEHGAGDIVNVSSTSGRQGRAFDAAYCASKFGVIGFSEALAEEVGRLGVRVQTVLPDAVDTPLWDQNGAIAGRPKVALSPTQVAEFILHMVNLPRDAYLRNPTIWPSRQRKRRSRSKTEG